MNEIVLVTGGHGFLGNAVCEVLRKNPQNVVLAPSRAKLDISDLVAVDEFWQAHSPTALVHLGAYARGLGGNLAAGSDAFVWNEEVIRPALLTALKYGIDKIFFAGTVAEYAYPYIELPLKEESVLSGPPHKGEIFYAYAKRLASSYLDAIQERWKTNISHGLLTNMYGPGDRFDPESGHVVAAMMFKVWQAQRDGAEEVTFWGNPTTTRDFIYVKDAATHIVNLLGTNSGRINIGSGITTTMEEVAKVICLTLNYRGDVHWDSTKPVGIAHRSLDVSRLLELSPVSPRTIHLGIVETLREETSLT